MPVNPTRADYDAALPERLRQKSAATSHFPTASCGSLLSGQSPLFRLFQLPMCRRPAICRAVKVVSRRRRTASASSGEPPLGRPLSCP